MTRCVRTGLIVAGCLLLLTPGCSDSSAGGPTDGGADGGGDAAPDLTPDVEADTGAPGDPWGVTQFFIELTEDDIEVQLFVDGSHWNELQIFEPGGALALEVDTGATMAAQGLSELKVDGWPSHFPVLGDPEHTEIDSIDDFLALFPTGTYRFVGQVIGGGTLEGEAAFSHALPALPEIVSPEEGEDPEVFAIEDAVIEWEPVTETWSGSGAIDIVRYEIIVEQVDPFRKLSIFLPASATQLRVPEEFLEPDSVYDVEVVAIEASDNQTISVAEFRTSDSAEAPEDTSSPDGAWGVTQFFIELTEDDIEVQSFVDGRRWDALRIIEPGGDTAFETEAGSYMGDQGLSELKVDGWPSHFPILGDPEHTEIDSIDDFLALFPAGAYTFEGDGVDGGTLAGQASFTHDLPALPEIVEPEEGEVLALDSVVIEWEPVTETWSGEGTIDIVEYEVIVEQVEPFRKLSVHLPATATRLTVPEEFLTPDSLYDVEVVAIEVSDNQTISVTEFETDAE